MTDKQYCCGPDGCTFGCRDSDLDAVGDLEGYPEIPDWRPTIRTFDSGATRDTDEGKLNYRRFFSPKVLKRRAEYMEKHRIQSNGEVRAPDNWKKGIPLEAYADSLSRHHHEFESLLEDGIWGGYSIEDVICAQMFNLEGFLYELLSAD